MQLKITTLVTKLEEQSTQTDPSDFHWGTRTCSSAHMPGNSNLKERAEQDVGVVTPWKRSCWSLQKIPWQPRRAQRRHAFLKAYAQNPGSC